MSNPQRQVNYANNAVEPQQQPVSQDFLRFVDNLNIPIQSIKGPVITSERGGIRYSGSKNKAYAFPNSAENRAGYISSDIYMLEGSGASVMEHKTGLGISDENFEGISG